MSKKTLTVFVLLFILLFALIATMIGYFIYPEEKEPIILDFKKDWTAGSYEIDYQNGIPSLEFSYNGFNYTTNSANSQEDSLPKKPVEWSLEKIELISANKSVERLQNSFVIRNSVYVLYAIVVNGEVYYSMPRVYTEQESYILVVDIDHDMIKISFYPNWINFWFISILGSLLISFVLTATAVSYYEKKQKGQ